MNPGGNAARRLDAAAAGTLPIGGELTVARLGYGAMRLTGPQTWGDPADRLVALELLRTAVAWGVNYIDTADSYGPHTNEALIRDALWPYPHGLVIATKGGVVRTGPRLTDRRLDGRPAHLKQAAKDSCRRLGVDSIDLYYLHWPDPDVPFSDQAGALRELRDAGVIRHAGLSNVSVEQFSLAREILPIAAVTSRYNLLEQGAADLISATTTAGAVFSPWFPTAVPSGSSPTATVTAVMRAHGISLAQLSLAWVLHRSPNILAIPGTSSRAHLSENIRAATVALKPAEYDALLQETQVR